MSLRLRWTLVLALISSTLIVAVAGVIELALRDQAARDALRWRDSRVGELQTRLELMGRQADDRVDALLDDPTLQSLLGRMAADSIATSDPVLRGWSAAHHREYELDQIILLDARGVVLSTALGVEHAGVRHRASRFLLSCLPHSPVLWQGGVGEEEGWLLGSVRTLRRRGKPFLVAGALRLDRGPLQEMRALIGVSSLRWGSARPGEIALTLPAGWQLERAIDLSTDPGPAPSAQSLVALRRRLFPLALGILLLTLLVAPWLAAGLARPLLRLVSAVEEIGRGERRLNLVPSGPREVRELGFALGRMAHDLGETEQRMRAAERRAAWREIARRIAHEIRNALSPLALALDNVETAVVRDDETARRALRSSLRTARDQLGSMERLVREFSGFARSPQLVLGPLDPPALLVAALTTVGSAFPDHDFRLEPGPELPPAIGDAEQIRRALHNLLKNAAEAAPEVPVRLTWGVGPAEGQWWIAVRDEGPGLSPEIAARLGEPYLTDKAEGTGLGLPVVMQIAEAHGGNLQWRNLSLRGLEMRMVLSLDPRTGAESSDPPSEEQR